MSRYIDRPSASDYDEDTALSAALAASVSDLDETEQLRLAMSRSLDLPSRASSSPTTPVLPPLRDSYPDDVDRRFEESLRKDREKVKLAAEREVRRLIEDEKIRENERKKIELENEIKRLVGAGLHLKYPVELADQKDLFLIRFKLPSGVVVNHSFHKMEPLKSVLDQLRFDTNHFGSFELTISPNFRVVCPPDHTPIMSCGFMNRILVLVNVV